MKKTNRFRFLLRKLDIRIILIIVSLLAVSWLQLPRLWDEFQVDEDFRTFYWMNKFQEPELFPDYHEGYTEIDLLWTTIPVTFKSLGYSLLFYFASFFVTPVFFSKLLSFFLMPMMVWYAFKFGQAVRGYSTGILLALGLLFLNLISSTSLSVLTGLQRSSALLLMVLFVYFFYCQKYGRAATVLFLSVLIYPQVFVLLVVTWGLFTLKLRLRTPYIRFLPFERGFFFLLVVMILGLFILTPALLPRFTDMFADLNLPEIDNPPISDEIFPTYQYFWENPHYGSGGRKPLFVYFPFVGRGGLVNKETDALNLLVMIVFGCLIYLIRGRKAFNLPEVLWCVLGASFIVFILAWLSAFFADSFLLYLPSRYPRIGLFLFFSYLIFLNFVDSMKDASSLILLNPQKLKWLIVACEIVIVGIILFYPSERTMIIEFNIKWLLAFAGLSLGVLSFFAKNTSHSNPNVIDVSRFGQTPAGKILIGITVFVLLLGWAVYASLLLEVSSLNPSQAERGLYDFVNTLPEDTLIAGTPCALDSIPLFAKRQILFSCERYDNKDPVVLKALEVYYTEKRGDLVDFCHTHHIDYLVIDSETYSTEYLQQGHLFFEPYNQKLLAKIDKRDKFVLADMPDEKKLFQSGNYYVVSCDAFK